jgi:hypothetical protein
MNDYVGKGGYGHVDERQIYFYILDTKSGHKASG